MNASVGAEPPSSGPDFAKKLFQLLQDKAHVSTVSWSPAGDSFVIWDMTAFTNDVLPRYFKHSNFSSFVRQLNKYDFHKVKLPSELKSKTPNVWEFQHPDFTRTNASGLDSIKRKVPTKREGTGAESVSPSGPQGVTQAQFRALEDRLRALGRDNAKLSEEVGILRSELDTQKKRNATMLADQVSARSVDEMLVNALQNITKSLNAQLGMQLPPVELSIAPLKSTSPKSQDSQTLQHHAPQPAATSIAPEQIKYTKEQRIMNRPQGSVLHVLLVEDDEVCISLCQRFLMKYGCTVVVSRDGLSAISEVKRVKFDLVLMDIVMPTLDGASATSIIRSFDNDTPIIAMTGNYQREDLMTYLNHGMTDILAKPFSKDDLYMILEKHHIDRLFTQPPGDGDDLQLDLDPASSGVDDPLLFQEEEGGDYKRRRYD